jgi:DNA-binding transcriptional LysR family regulator
LQWWYASPGYLEKYGSPREPRDLVFHNCLAYTEASSQSVWTFVDQNGEKNVIRISGRFLANSAAALLALVLRDAGIMLAPDYLVEDELKTGRLIRLLPDHSTPETPVHTVYPHSHYLAAKTRTFIDFLAMRFGHSVRVLGNGNTNVLQTSIRDAIAAA